MPDTIPIAGPPDPTAAICADVEGWLIALFVSSADMPVFSARPRHCVLATPRSSLDCYHLAIAVLGTDSPDLRALFTWARAKGRRRIKRHRRLRVGMDLAGSTITDHWVAFGVNRRTFDRRRKRACVRVAQAWNATPVAKRHPGSCGGGGRPPDRELR